MNVESRDGHVVIVTDPPPEQAWLGVILSDEANGLAVDAVALDSPADSRGTWTPPAVGRSRWFRFDRAYVNAHAQPRAIRTRRLPTLTDPQIDCSDHLVLDITVEPAPGTEEDPPGGASTPSQR